MTMAHTSISSMVSAAAAPSRSAHLRILLFLVVLLLSTSSILSTFALTPCYTQVLTGTPVYTLQGPASSLSGQSLILFPPSYVSIGTTPSAIWLTKPTYWTSGFKASFDVQLTLESLAGILAPPGLAFVLSAANGSPNPPPLNLADANQLGYGNMTSTIALEIDLFVDTVLGDTVAPAVSLHTGYSGPNSARSTSQVPSTPAAPLSFTLKSQTMSLSIEYTASDHRFNYCVGAGSSNCASAILNVTLFNQAWNSINSSDGLAYFGFVSTSTLTQFGGITISNFTLSTVQLSSSTSYIPGTMNGLSFVTSNTTAQSASGLLITSDSCYNALSTSSAPNISIIAMVQGQIADFHYSITNIYNGGYNIFVWSPSCSYPNTSVTLNFFINGKPIQGATQTITFIPGPLDYTKSLSTLPNAPTSSIFIGTQFPITITFLDALGNQVAAPATMSATRGWFGDIVSSIDVTGRTSYSFVISSSIPRAAVLYQFRFGTTAPSTASQIVQWPITVVTPPSYSITYSNVPASPFTARATSVANQTLGVSLNLGMPPALQAIPANFVFGKLYYGTTQHPTKPPPYPNGQLLSTTVLPANNTPGMGQLPFFSPGTGVAFVAGVWNFTVWTGDKLVRSLPITINPSIPNTIEQGVILPGYISSTILYTTTVPIYLKDQFNNYIAVSYGIDLIVRFTSGSDWIETTCDGAAASNTNQRVKCTYNISQGQYDVALGMTAGIGSGTIQLSYLGTAVGSYKLVVTFQAGFCASCTTYSKISPNVTSNDYFQFNMSFFTTANTPFTLPLTTFLILPATPSDWIGSYSTSVYPLPAVGKSLIQWQVSPTLKYQQPKVTLLIPYFDGVPGPPINTTILPLPSSLCLNNTQYSKVPLPLEQGAPITFDMLLYDFTMQPYQQAGKLASIGFIFFPNISIQEISSEADSMKQNVIHVTIAPVKLVTTEASPTVQLKITPTIVGFSDPVPNVPLITIKPSLPVCVECTRYSVFPKAMKQGESFTFLIFLYNATIGSPLIFFPSDFMIAVDSNPSLYTTPVLVREGLNYRLNTQFVVNPSAGNISFVFPVKIYGVYAPATSSITVMPPTNQQPVVCAACTVYKAADGMSALPTTVPSGGVLTFTLFLLDSSSNLLGLLLPTSNITFDLSSGVTQYHVSSNPGVDDTKYSVTITFYEIGPIDQPRLLTVWPILNGENAPSINITLLPPVYCASCTRYAQQSTTIIPAGEQFKLSILLYTQNGLTLGSYLPIENVTVIGTEIVKVNVVVRDDIPILQSAPAPAPNKLVVTSAAAAAAAAGGVVVKASTTTTTTTTGTASGYEISITFNIPITTTAITTSISVALNGVSINRPITLTLRPPVPPTDQPDPCLDIDPRLTCPDQSRQCISTIILLPERNGGKNYTYECRDILKIQKIIPTTTWSNVSTLITITMTYDLPTNLHLILNGHDIFSLTPSATNSRMFTFMMPPAVELNYTIAHNQTNGLRVNFSLSAHIGAYDYLLNDIPSPGLTLLPTPCVSVGTYWIPSTDACLPCPSHAYCPGGTDIYPLPGYYSTSNNDPTITKCLVANACNGFSSDQAGEIEFSVTDQCNMNAGYTGILCSDCTSDHYKQELVCRSCGLDDAAQKQLILVLIVALVVFGVMSFGVAFIKDEKLAIYITIIVFIQQCSFVGSIGSSKLSSGGLAAFFQFLSLLNFEVAYFKLGCTVPQITYVKVFWATILMMIVAALMLTIASGLFAYTRSEEYLRLKGAERSKVFSRRMQNSMTILGVVVYLQLTTQFFKGLFCVEINDQHVLQVEPSTVCYEGGHLITAIFIWPLLFAYSCGFPILCFWLVMRTRSLNLWSSSAAKFVYLYRGLKIRFIYFKQFNFVTSFALALQITLSTTSNVTVRLATAFLFFSLNVFLVGVFWPYYKKFQNWLAIVAGLANALSGLAILTVLSSQVGQDSSKLGDLEGIGLFFLGFSILTFFVLLIFPARYLSKKYLPGIESTEDDELLQSGHYDQLAASRTSKGLGTNPLDAKRQAKTIKTLDAAAAAAADSSAIELQEHQLVQQRADDSSPFDNEPQKPIVKHLDIDTEKNEEYINGPTSPSAASNNNNNNNNKYAAPPPPDHHHHHHHPSLPPSSSSSASASPPPLPLPSPSASPGLPIHDHSDYTQSDDTTIQSSDVELQPIPSPPQPKFDADEYEREHEEGLL